MPPKRTRKGRGKDPDVGMRLVRTLLLREQGKTFPEIRELLGFEFGRTREPDSRLTSGPALTSLSFGAIDQPEGP